MLARHVETGKRDPYAVLGIDRSITLAEARKAWLQLVRDNHPDRLVAHGLPEEFVQIANARLAAINAAFEAVEQDKRAA